MSLGSPSSSSSTYEAIKARESTQNQADKIHWDDSAAFRDHPYRQLHHQRGTIGIFRVRLLEASNLQRSYWSALALGPVKHLGFSKAHGAVSSFCTLGLRFEDGVGVCEEDKNGNGESGKFSAVVAGSASIHCHTDEFYLDQKPAAKIPPSRLDPLPDQVSPVMPSENNPVWDNCQFEFPLLKGAMPADGMRIVVHVRVDEVATAVEQLVPGIPAGGDDRLLGQGRLDVTELCLGETITGQILPGIKDSWIPISLPVSNGCQNSHNLEHQYQYNDDDPLAPPVAIKKNETGHPKVTGKVRFLVSYHPFGLEPQPKDVVALEAFARRNPSLNSCRPLLQPLMPLTVLERRGSYLLCEYVLADRRKACLRLHRNAVFVVERQNLMDVAHNLALLPADAFMSTPVGGAAAQALGPVVAASKELLMPALLSLKLLWLAVRTTTLAGVSGAEAIGRTMWQEGSQSLTGSGGPVTSTSDSNAGPLTRQDSRLTTAQFIQL